MICRYADSVSRQLWLKAKDTLSPRSKGNIPYMLWYEYYYRDKVVKQLCRELDYGSGY